jgi:type IV secretion system protein VirD4
LEKQSNKKINNIQKIANLLINGSYSSKALFTGLVLYLYATDEKIKTLGKIARMINYDLVQELSEGLKKINKSNNSHCFDIISGFLSQSKEQREKIINELKESLYLWTNPLVDYATSESDFDIASLKTLKTTIYVGLNPDEIVILQPLMRLFYNHAFERLMSASMLLGNESENDGVTVILDDFYTLGKLESYAFGYLRGYKVRLFAIASSIQDIEELYGESEASNIISDCNFKIFFGANDFKTAKHISYLCPDKSLDKKENKEIMSWQEIMNLPQDLQIVLAEKEQPLIIKKMKYYENDELKKRIANSC